MTVANKKRKKITYKKGYIVFLSTKNIDTARPSKKLDHKMISLFKIFRETNESYELDLPDSIKQKCLVFYSSLLQRAATDPLSGQEEQPAPPITVQDEEHFEVDAILDARRHYRKVQFKAK